MIVVFIKELERSADISVEPKIKRNVDSETFNVFDERILPEGSSGKNQVDGAVGVGVVVVAEQFLIPRPDIIGSSHERVNKLSVRDVLKHSNVDLPAKQTNTRAMSLSKSFKFD